jgi:hypothetical protein
MVKLIVHLLCQPKDLRSWEMMCIVCVGFRFRFASLDLVRRACDE